MSIITNIATDHHEQTALHNRGLDKLLDAITAPPAKLDAPTDEWVRDEMDCTDFAGNRIRHVILESYAVGVQTVTIIYTEGDARTQYGWVVSHPEYLRERSHESFTTATEARADAEAQAAFNAGVEDATSHDGILG